MTRDQAAAIAKAIGSAHAAFWTVCDAESRAIGPTALDAPEGFLDEAYETALQVESLAVERGISWAEARELV